MGVERILTFISDILMLPIAREGVVGDVELSV